MPHSFIFLQGQLIDYFNIANPAVILTPFPVRMFVITVPAPVGPAIF